MLEIIAFPPDTILSLTEFIASTIFVGKLLLFLALCVDSVVDVVEFSFNSTEVVDSVEVDS